MLRYLAVRVFILVIGLCGVANANSALVRDVRFGWHGAYARVVFDLAESTEYRLQPGADAATILIEFLNLHSMPSKVVWQTRNPLVRAVHFSASANTLVGKVILSAAGTVQRHFLMHTPPRLVIDVVRQAPSPSAELADVPNQSTSNPSDDQHRTTTQKEESPEPPVSGAVLPPLLSNQHKKEGKQTLSKPASNVETMQALSRNQLLQLAESQWRQGELDAAHASYLRFMERFSDYKHMHFVMVRLADILQQQKRLRDALEAYQAVIDTYPGSEGAIISRIRVAELAALSPHLLADDKEGRFEAYRHPIAALKDIIQTIPLSPLANIARFKIGEIHLYRHESEEALKSFRDLLHSKLQPELMQDVQRQTAKALHQLLTSKEQEGAFFDVLHAFFEHQAYLAPDAKGNPDLLLPLGIGYAKLGLFPEAQSILASLTDSSVPVKQRTVATLEQARVLAKLGRTREALDLLEPVVPVAEMSMRAEVLQTVSHLAMRAEQPAKAIGYLQMVFDLTPSATERGRVLSQLADAYLAQGDRQRALQSLQRCTALTEADGTSRPAISESCQFRMAALLLSTGQLQPALKAYRSLLDEFPETRYRDRVLFAISEIYQATENQEERVKTFQALRASTTSSLWKEIANDALEHQEWQNRFSKHLAQELNPSVR